jgi:type IV pilus assembly protein PilB
MQSLTPVSTPEEGGEPVLINNRFALGEEMLVCRYSTLYHALDRTTGTPVVLRKLHELIAGNEREARLQMLREGRVLQKLNQRNIPRVLEIVEDTDDKVYLILEDFSGVTLEGFLAELGEPGGALLLRRFLEQFLNVLKYLHNQDPPIINRDLRPDTIMLTPHGVIKIVDFDSARLREDAKDVSHTLYRAQGSPVYAAPEQLAGGSTMAGNDIYSAGAVLYYLATGKHPAESMALFDGTAELEPLVKLRPDIGPELLSIIPAMMTPDPKARPKRIEDVERLLLDLSPAPRKVSRPTLLRLQVQRPTGDGEMGGVSVDTNGPANPGVWPPPAEGSATGQAPAPHVSVNTGTAPAPDGTGAVAPLPPGQRKISSMTSAGFTTVDAGHRLAGTGHAGEALPVATPAVATSAPADSAVKVTTNEPPKKKSIWAGIPGIFKGKKSSGVSAAPSSNIIISEDELKKYEYVDLANHELDRQAGRMLPETVCKSIQGVCIGTRSATELTIVCKDPTLVYIYDQVSFATQGRYKAVLMRADPLMIDLAMEYIYKIASIYEKLPFLEWLERKKFQAETLDVKSASNTTFGTEDITSPIIETMDRLIKEAISVGASDIHMESYETELLVRYRIDGVLHEIATFDTKEAGALTKRVKIMASMDIAQDRVCQGGRISVSVAGRELDLRVSIVPVPAGESIVMRLLKKGAFNLTLRDLGFSERDEKRYLKVLDQPYGMILVSGPTGSGKSTTLYASLKEIQRPDRKLLTVEDPIEYQMPRICQVQVNLAPSEESKRVTFARTLREFLRQDPDVILVGEIRDPETAAIAVQAALTGHMLLSTIHTNDSIGIFARLRDMGIEPYLIGSTLCGGLAQRLARRICPDCKEEVPVPESLKPEFEKEKLEPKVIYRGRGGKCKPCHGTGYRGRLAVYEILEITPDIREMISRCAHDDEIKAQAYKHEFHTLWQDGIHKIAEGMLTPDEVQRVCMTL